MSKKRHRIKTLGAAYLGALSLLASSLVTPLSVHAAEQAELDCNTILSTMDDLHLSEDKILVEVGEFYELIVEPVEAAKPLGWSINDIEFSDPDLVKRYYGVPEGVTEVTTADGKRPVYDFERIKEGGPTTPEWTPPYKNEEEHAILLEQTNQLRVFIEGQKTGSLEIKFELSNPEWEKSCTHGHAKKLTLTCKTQTVPAGYKAALRAGLNNGSVQNSQQNFRGWPPAQKAPTQPNVDNQSSANNTSGNTNGAQGDNQGKDDADNSDNSSDSGDDSDDSHGGGSGNKPDSKPGDSKPDDGKPDDGGSTGNPDIGDPPVAPVDPNKPDDSGDSGNQGNQGDQGNTGDQGGTTTPTDPTDPDDKGDQGGTTTPTDPVNPDDKGDGTGDGDQGNQGGNDKPDPDDPNNPGSDDPDKPGSDDPDKPDPEDPSNPDKPPVEELKKYDTSTWGFDPDQLSFVYDGQEHHPVLTGVPEEVQVKVVAAETNAGQYTYRVAFNVPEGYEDVPDMAVDYEITPLTPEISYKVNPATGELEMTTTGILQEDLDGEIQTSVIDATDTELSVLSVTPGYYNIKTQMKIAEDKKGNYTIPEINQSEYLNVTESNPWLNFGLEYSEENGQLIVKVNIKDLKIPQVGGYDKVLTGLKLFYDEDRLEYVSQKDGDWSQYIMDMMSMNRITAEYNGAVNGGNPLPENSTIAILTFNYKDPNDKADLVFRTGTFGVRDKNPQDICPDNNYGQSPQRDFYYQSGGNFVSVANPTGAVKVDTQVIESDPMDNAFYKGSESGRDNALTYLQNYVDQTFTSDNNDDEGGGLGGSDDNKGEGEDPDNSGDSGNTSGDNNGEAGDNTGDNQDNQGGSGTSGSSTTGGHPDNAEADIGDLFDDEDEGTSSTSGGTNSTGSTGNTENAGSTAGSTSDNAEAEVDIDDLFDDDDTSVSTGANDTATASSGVGEVAATSTIVSDMASSANNINNANIAVDVSTSAQTSAPAAASTSIAVPAATASPVDTGSISTAPAPAPTVNASPDVSVSPAPAESQPI